MIALLGKLVSVLAMLAMSLSAFLIYYLLPEAIINVIHKGEFEYIITFILMYVGSSLIELFVIQKIFRYPYKSLWVPISVGNLITYILIAMFDFFLTMQL